MNLSPNVVTAVREGVRNVVRDTPALRQDPALQQKVTERMLGVSLAAAELLAEDQRLSRTIAENARRRQPATLATAQAAADMNSGRAVQSAAGVLQATRQAIDFPAFVTNLITGVFQAIQTTNIQQLQAFSDLMQAVGSSTDDFSQSQIGRGRAAQWAVDRFGVFTLEADGDEPNLTLKEDEEMPDSETLMGVLGASAEEVSAVDEYDLAESFIPLIQRKLGRDRQSMLATMIKMGLQRVVVDDGRLHASMRLQVDARSIAEQTQGEQFDTRVETEASGSFGVGAWGASAKLSASVGYVTSDEQYSREDIAVQAGLRSSVDLRFRTLPLDVRQIADDRQLEEVQSRSMNPDAPAEFENLLGENPERVTSSPTFPTPAGPGDLISQDRGTQGEARRAQQEAAERERESEGGGGGGGGGEDGNASAEGRDEAGVGGDEGRSSAGGADERPSSASEEGGGAEGGPEEGGGAALGLYGIGRMLLPVGVDEQSSYTRAPALAGAGGQWAVPGRPPAQIHAFPVLPRS